MLDFITIGNNQIEKHTKYKNQYMPEELFWGLGIENELYLEFEKRKQITEEEFINNHKRERYSLDYYSNYKTEELPKAFKKILKLMGSNTLFIPLMMNSHSFTKTDHLNNSKTLYTTSGVYNPDFTGKTLLEFLIEKDEYFKQDDENSNLPDSWIFDGDTIEFVSTRFYKVTLSEIIGELEQNKKTFINKLNYWFEKELIFQEYGKIKFMEQNHPFSCYLTNIENIGMFNNGTIHLNLTLPTKLDKNSKILDKKDFIEKHKKLIKLIQWFEPIILGTYGSPDPFTILDKLKERKRFSNCSQRNAISRYISVGTYDTDLMEPGKILTKSIDMMEINNLEYWWYNKYHETSAYVKLEKIGLDINFNKHWNHGIEIRFLDHISDIKLIQECFEFIIYLADTILENKQIEIPNPIKNKIWNEITLKTMIDGMDTLIDNETKQVYEKIIGFDITKNNLVDIYYEIFNQLKNKYNPIYKSVNKIDGSKKYIHVPKGEFSSLTIDITNTHDISQSKNIFTKVKHLQEQINLQEQKYIDKEVQTDEIQLNEIQLDKIQLDIDYKIKDDNSKCCCIM